MATSVGAVFLEVVPALDRFASMLSAGTLSDVKKVGQQAGKDFGDALSGGSKAGLDSLKSQLSSAALATERASVQVATAHNTAATAADKVQLAEARLADTRKKYSSDSSQVLAAEQRLSQAKRDAELQSGKTALAENTLKDAQDKQALSAQALKDKQEAGAVTSASVAKGAGVLAIGVTGAAVAMGGIAVKSAADFEQQLTRLATSAGESTGNLKMVGDGILKMAGDTGTSTQQLTSGMYMIESAGYHGADGLTVLKAAAQGAKAENADLGTVANAVTDILTDYHKSASDAAIVTSAMVQTTAEGKTTFEALSGAMSSVAPVASAAGIKISELLGDLATMTSHGVSADQAAQNLANAIRSLSNPTLAATKELAQFGLDASELSKNLGEKGVSGTMEEISQAIMQHMGPAGTTLLNTFNQSKQAAGDADAMFKSLPPNLQKLAQAMSDGKISQHEWTQGLKQIDPIQANLLKQWLVGEKRASGFNDMLKSGGNAAQTYTQALAKATGNSTSMNVALMLTGENAAQAAANIDGIVHTSTEAGNNVKGWSDIQETFNQKLAEMKAGVQAATIELGQKLLPAASAVMGWLLDLGSTLRDVGGWWQRNANWIGLVATVVAGLVGPFLAVKAAMEVWAIATKAVAIAQAALNLVLEANPIMLIVAAIAGLVAGLVYAYFHFKTFHDIVNAVGNFLKTVFLAVIHALVEAFHWVVHAAEAVGHFFETVFGAVIHAVGVAIGWVADHWKIFAAVLAVIFAPITIAVGLFVLIVKHAHQIAEAFQWLWSNVLRPVFNFIGEAVVILAKIILAVAIAPIVVAVRGLGAIFRWLWENAIKPAFDGIGVAAHWLYDNVFKPVFEAIGAAVHWVYENVLLRIWRGLQVDWQILQAALRFLHDNVWMPIWNAIGAAVDWVYQNVLLRIWNGLRYDWLVLKEALRILYEDVFKPTWDALGAAVRWVYDHVLVPIWNGLKYDWQVLKEALRILYEDIIKPTWDAIGSAIGWVYHNVIRPIWDAFKYDLGLLEDAFKIAVAHIGDIWDVLKKAFGTPIEFVIRTVLNDGIIKAINWILSAVGTSIPRIPDPNLPTFAVGGVVPGYAPGVDSVHALLSPGEGIIVPQAVRALGGEGGIAAINHMFGGSGRPVLAGGVPGFAGGGFVSDILAGIGGAAAAAWHGLEHVALGGMRAAAEGFFNGVANPLLGTIPGGPDNIARKMVTGEVNKVETSILDWLGAKDQAAMASLGGSIPVGDRLAIINAALAADGIPQSLWPMWEAGLNTLITRESGWSAGAVNNWDSNAARGTPSMGLAQVILPTFEAYRNRSLMDNLLDPVANVAAAINYIDSVYGGIQNVQQANANLPPRGYASGGVVPGGPNVEIHVHGSGGNTSLANEIERRLMFAMR